MATLVCLGLRTWEQTGSLECVLCQNPEFRDFKVGTQVLPGTIVQ